MATFRLNPNAKHQTIAARLLMAGGVQALASEVDARIEATARLNCSHLTLLRRDAIHYACSGGWVTINGTVSEVHHRILAELAVSSLPGVRGVANRLVLAKLHAVPGRDAWITLKVKTSLTFHKHDHTRQTRVNTRDGVVSLTGHAPSGADLDLVTRFTQSITGVKRVSNLMTVTNPLSPTLS